MRKTFIFILFILTSFQVQAAEVAGVRFNDIYVAQNTMLQLQGTGIKKYLFFKAFAAGFYKAPGDGLDLLGDSPKRIEVEYFIHIPSRKLNHFTIEKMKDNISQQQMAMIKEQLVQMKQFFVDLKPGDRFSLTYLPKVGTQFSHNGRITGIIKGREFAKAIFSVWIGDKPFDNQLKAEVLGHA